MKENQNNPLLSALFFYTGITSLILYPRPFGLRFNQIGIIVLVIIAFLWFFIRKLRLSKEEVLLTCLAVLFTISASIGTISTGIPEGIMTSLVFIFCFIVVLFSAKAGYNAILLKGFFYSGLVSSIYIIIDAAQFYFLSFEPLIWTISPETRNPDIMGIPHPFLNFSQVGPLSLYRPSGLCPDPGVSVTGITLGYITYKEKWFSLRDRKIYDLIIIAAILLSVSKTSIIAICGYYVLRRLKFITIVEKDGASIKKRSSLWYFLVGLICALFIVGCILPYDGNGNERHLKYFSSLIYFPLSDPVNFLFGYGMTNTGYYFEDVVPWSKGFFAEGQVCESTLANIFLYGGIVGSLFWIYTFSLIIKPQNRSLLIVSIILTLLMFGYTISGSWFFFVVLSAVFKAIKISNHRRQPFASALTINSASK